MKVKVKGDSHGIKSSGDAYFPKDAKEHKFPQPGQVGEFDYPDTAEAIIKEQSGNVKMAKSGKSKGMYRK